MPIYEYECQQHGRFELKQGLGATMGHCPECSQRGERLISKVAVILEGDPPPKYLGKKDGSYAEMYWPRGS